MRWAASSGKMDLLKYLLDKKADPNANEGSGMSWAAHHGQLEAVKMLVEYGADFTVGKHRPLRWAIENGHAETVRFLIRQYLKPKLAANYALEHMTYKISVPIVELLLELGADVNVGQGAPLEYACEQGYTDVVHFLLANGAQPHAKALAAAARTGRMELVQSLIQRGVHPTAGGNAALLAAAEHGQTVMVEFLLQHGADKNPEDMDKALVLATKFSKPQVAKLLIDRGADVDPRNTTPESVPDSDTVKRKGKKMFGLW
jgi:ankyrin repeat protein